MAVFNKFNCFTLDLASKKHDLGSDVLKIYLTNAAPNAGTHTRYDGVTGTTGPAEIAAGNGYTLTGATAAVSSSTQTSGTYKLVLSDPPTWSATGGTIGPLRYAVLYNSSSTNKELIGWWDYGASVTLQATETVAVDLDQTNGVLTIA
jgi:hypothetical protein